MFDRRSAVIGLSTFSVGLVLGPALSRAAPVMVTFADVPIPDNVAVVPPSAELAPSVSNFSGVWTGRWNDYLAHVLAVEEIVGDTVYAVYAWGKAKDWGIDPGWIRKRGRVMEGHLALDLSYGGRKVTADYDLISENKLKAIYKAPGIESRATLKRYQI